MTPEDHKLLLHLRRVAFQATEPTRALLTRCADAIQRLDAENGTLRAEVARHKGTLFRRGEPVVSDPDFKPGPLPIGNGWRDPDTHPDV